MSPMSIGWIVMACVFGGVLLGMALRLILPEHHLSADSKDVIKLGMALTATMSALVLALLTNSAKGSYDAQRNELTQLSANIILLDRVLAHYGPESKEARDLLKLSVSGMIDRIWPENRSGRAELAPNAAVAEGFFDKIQELSPQNEVQRSLQAQALKMSIDIGQARLLLLRAGRPLDPYAVSRIAGFLGNHHLSQLRPFRASECDRHRYPVPLCAIGFWCDLSDHGAGPAIRRPDSDLQRSVAQRHHASRAVAWEITPRNAETVQCWQVRPSIFKPRTPSHDQLL